MNIINTYEGGARAPKPPLPKSATEMAVHTLLNLTAKLPTISVHTSLAVLWVIDMQLSFFQGMITRYHLQTNNHSTL